MQVTINKTISVEHIIINADGRVLELDADSKVIESNESGYMDFHFDLQFLIDTNWHEIEWVPVPDWITELMESTPAVGSLIDAKYHKLFGNFINENINL